MFSSVLHELVARVCVSALFAVHHGGVPKAEYGSRDFYDIWLPELAPSEGLVKMALGAGDARAWQAFVTRYRAR